jgi:hypothetical protein
MRLRGRSGVVLACAAAGLLLAGCGSPAPPPPTGDSTVDGATAAAASGRWRPEVGQSWQWQLSGPLDLSVDADIYDLDGLDTPAATVAALHAAGRRVVCYVSVGTWEPYRADAADFPDEVLGTALEDWPDERWLDIRRMDVLGPLLLRRLDICAGKGFDAVEPDNVDAYANDSGFDLTPEDQLVFNRWLARAVHARGMAVGLKNDLDQVPDLVEHFDFAVNEECLAYRECEALQPFLAAGKAVLHAEYDGTAEQLCVAPSGFSSILKPADLAAPRRTCAS